LTHHHRRCGGSRPTEGLKPAAANADVISGICLMRIKLRVIFVVCLLPLLPSAQRADPGGSSKLLALENSWDQAEERGDIHALDLIFDDSMIYIDEDGSLLTKAQFLDRVTKEAGTDVQWLLAPDMNVRLYGDTAVVVGRYSYRGIHQRKAHERSGRFVDTWVFKEGRWVCVVAQSTPILP